MIRPLYRWKSFWLGLFVLVFLGWAYVDSFRFHAMAYRYDGRQTVIIYRSFGGTRFGEGPTRMLGFHPDKWGFSYAECSVYPFYWGSRDVRSFEVPDAPVFSSFMGLWGGWLAWRWRRLKRRQEEVEQIS